MKVDKGWSIFLIHQKTPKDGSSGVQKGFGKKGGLTEPVFDSSREGYESKLNAQPAKYDNGPTSKFPQFP